jgi:hypothetical protein
MNKENDPYWFEHDPIIDGLEGQPPDWYWDYPNIERLKDEIPRGDQTPPHTIHPENDGISTGSEVSTQQSLE